MAHAPTRLFGAGSGGLVRSIAYLGRPWECFLDGGPMEACVVAMVGARVEVRGDIGICLDSALLALVGKPGGGSVCIMWGKQWSFIRRSCCRTETLQLLLPRYDFLCRVLALELQRAGSRRFTLVQLPRSHGSSYLSFKFPRRTSLQLELLDQPSPK